MAGMHFLMRPTSTCSSSTDKNSVGSRSKNTCVQEGKTVPNTRKTNSKCRRSHSNVSEDEIHSYQTERRRGEGGGGGGGGRASVGGQSGGTGESGRFPQVQARDSWDSLMTLSRGDITCTLSSEVSFNLSWICCVSQLICDCICHHL